jgi:hypothetical protein
LSFGPSDWIGDSDQIEKQISVCKEIIGTSKKSLEGSSLTLAFVTKFERDISALQGEISKCGELLNGKCVFSVRSAGSIEILTSNSKAIEQPILYNLEIKKLQDFLDSKPCFPGGIGDQLMANIYCSNAVRNIEILKRELPTIQAAAEKAAAEKAAAEKAAAEKAAAEKAAAEKAAAEKAAAEKAAAKPVPKPVAKEKAIVCLKGKSSLKVIGKNPKCPAGYKVKK